MGIPSITNPRCGKIPGPSLTRGAGHSEGGIGEGANGECWLKMVNAGFSGRIVVDLVVICGEQH